MRSQKKKIPMPSVPLTITPQVEEVKDSPSPEQLKEIKGKEPQEETMMKEERPIEGTSKNKTPAENFCMHPCWN
jgi:hypothetical protein